MRVPLPACLLMLLMATGCGKKALQPHAVIMPGQPGPANNGTDGSLTPINAPPQAPLTYQGMPSTYWAERMSHPDTMVRKQASVALGQLEHDGFPYLLQGMKSNSAELKLVALQAVYKPVLLKNHAQVLPLLLQMAQHSDPELRHNAVVRLAWLESKGEGALRTLQYIASVDQDPTIRNAAKESMAVITYHVTGIPPSHGAAPHMEKPR